MLVNLSNHPSDMWKKGQIDVARRLYMGIYDLPFPHIGPNLETTQVRVLAEEYVEKCLALMKRESEKNAVHVAGEATFIHAFVPLMQSRGVDCIASTTERRVRVLPNGDKQVSFNFVQFRKYPCVL